MLSKLCISTPKPWLPQQQINRSIAFTFAPKQYNNELLKLFTATSNTDEGMSNTDKTNNTDLVLVNTLYDHCFEKQLSRNDLLMDMSKDYLRTIDEKEALLFAYHSREDNLSKKLDACYKERERFMSTMHEQCTDLTKELDEKKNELAELKSCNNMTKSDLEKLGCLKVLLDEYKTAVDTANVHEERIKLAKVVMKYNKLVQYFDKIFKTIKEQLACARNQGVFTCTESGIISRQDAVLYMLHQGLSQSQSEIEQLRSYHEREVGELRLKHVNEVKGVRREYEERLQDAERKNYEKMRLMEKRVKELEKENARCKVELTQKDETIEKLHRTVQHLDQTVLDFDGIKQKLNHAVSDREAWEQTCRKINIKCQQLMKDGKARNANADSNTKKGGVESDVDIIMKIHLESNVSVQNELREQVGFLQTENNKMSTKLKESAENKEELNQRVTDLQNELEQVQQQKSDDLDLTDEYLALFRNTSNYDLEMQNGRLVFVGGNADNNNAIEIDSGIFGESDDEEIEDALMIGQRLAPL